MPRYTQAQADTDGGGSEVMEKDLITEPNTCQYCTHWFQCGLCTHEPDLFMETPEHWPETTNIDTCKGYVELSDLWEYCYI